ncbi:RNA polymerase sigma-70 factor [Actinacidiphila cocklensis]|uniref:RNA polymerase sigma-70 factor n=1 Tax=Actinacidiphila cocklensis TaxID=887465 RepID=A0A9W4DVZ5_9ACTN|nr:RNA polymerase sigma-70 factor [Actinacidiphila cocklensis]WSX72630.1 RNA polymerase sigma-70 factor [Streptomyces sp. NBC_00899]WSX81301.1 RNA polymerase sigma-70 factor [Streptomyces sp. NBC_00899]CAG6397035.1 RNA polymerase sigma-70 factor [Actinacidiphila cocklensis]
MSDEIRTGPRSAAAETFERHRPVMTGVAYRMLGRFADAEDVVQEAWLRWADTDRSQVREPRAFLVRTTTRLAIDRLRHVQSRREAYVGEWLPEPLTTDAGAGAEEHVLLAETVSLAMLVLLESLSPLERAVFVLREAFGYRYAEIAAILDRAEPAVRQLAGRARRHVEAREQRFDADPEVSARLTERFLAACTGGDLDGLLALLAPDVRLIGDGGGVQKAPRRILASAADVGRFLHAISDDVPPAMGVAFREVNGAPAVVITSYGRPHTVVSLETRDGRIACVYLLTNPGKLTGIR